MPKDPKFTVKESPDGKKELFFYSASNVNIKDLIEAVAQHFPGYDMSKIHISPCMIGTITTKPS
jgi:hypothetical protein